MCSLPETHIPYPSHLSPTFLLLLTLDPSDPAKRAEKGSGLKIAKTLLFRISKAASQGYMLPPSKNMKQQEENVYWSCLPTSQAEGKIGIFIMRRGVCLT